MRRPVLLTAVLAAALTGCSGDDVTIIEPDPEGALDLPEGRTRAEPADVHRELPDVPVTQGQSSWTEERRGVVVADVLVVTDDLQAAADAELGSGVVDLSAS